LELSVPASELQQVHTLDPVATVIGGYLLYRSRFVVVLVSIFRQMPICNSDICVCYSCSLYMIDFSSH